jgi:hypothetical protein
LRIKAERVAIEHCRGQPFCKIVNLTARITQASDLNRCFISELQQRASWKRQQVQTARCHVLTDIAR